MPYNPSSNIFDITKWAFFSTFYFNIIIHCYFISLSIRSFEDKSLSLFCIISSNLILFSSTTFFGALVKKSLLLRRFDIEFISFSIFSSSLITLRNSAARSILAGISNDNSELFTLKLADLSEKSETSVIFEIFKIFYK